MGGIHISYARSAGVAGLTSILFAVFHFQAGSLDFIGSWPFEDSSIFLFLRLLRRMAGSVSRCPQKVIRSLSKECCMFVPFALSMLCVHRKTDLPLVCSHNTLKIRDCAQIPLISFWLGSACTSTPFVGLCHLSTL